MKPEKTNAKPYWQKLRDPRWQKKRLEIMERDEFACRTCFESSKTLNVHHRFYEKNKEPWEYDNNVLVTLCEGCHEKASDEIKIIQREIGYDDIREDVLILLKCLNDPCLQGLTRSCITFMQYALRNFDDLGEDDLETVALLASPSDLRNNFFALIGPIIDRAQRNWDSQIERLKKMEKLDNEN